MKRVFVGVDISDEARERVVDYVDALKALSAGVRVGWERPEKLHLTLKFLGNTSEPAIAEICNRLAPIAAKAEAFEIGLSGTGVFPAQSRPKVLWIGISDETRALARLAESVETECTKVGFQPEKRPFSPHLTIARLREPERSRDLVAGHFRSQFAPVPFTVTELILFESKLLPSGSVYSKLAVFPFSSG